MNDEQRFLFDLQGFLVVPGVLSAAELATLNAIADEKVERYSSPVEDWEEHQCSFWGQPLVDLIDHPKVVPYLLELVGPYFRIDHDYCMFMRRGDKRGGLHGGSHPVHAAGDPPRQLLLRPLVRERRRFRAAADPARRPGLRLPGGDRLPGRQRREPAHDRASRRRDLPDLSQPAC